MGDPVCVCSVDCLLCAGQRRDLETKKRVSNIARVELYALAIFGGILGHWTTGLVKHCWYIFVNKVASHVHVVIKL